jgi:signal transduction histidine kinase
VVLVTFRDYGPGIPGDVMPRIFDPFFTTKDVGRAPASASPSPTASSRNTADDHREQRSDGGAIFEVELPVASEGGKVTTGPITS